MVQYATGVTAEATSGSFGPEPYIELIASAPGLMRLFLTELASHASENGDSALPAGSGWDRVSQAAVILCQLFEDARLASSLLSSQEDVEAAVTRVLESDAARHGLKVGAGASSNAACQ